MKEYEQTKGVQLPPTWCSGICRNAMNEVCLKNCAVNRDCSGFEMKKGFKLKDLPRFPLDASAAMTKEEKFTAVTVYLAKVVDHLQGVENEPTIYPPIRRQNLHGSGSSRIPEDLKIEDLLLGVQKGNPSPENRTEREDPSNRPSEVDGKSG